MIVYVCYEENNHELANENGAIEYLTVFDDAEKAMDWFRQRVVSGRNAGYMMDAEDEKVHEHGLLDECKVFEDIEKGWATLTLFNGWRENWDDSYAICVGKKEVK